jgi:hypothetical protein
MGCLECYYYVVRHILSVWVIINDFKAIVMCGLHSIQSGGVGRPKEKIRQQGQ